MLANVRVLLLGVAAGTVLGISAANWWMRGAADGPGADPTAPSLASLPDRVPGQNLSSRALARVDAQTAPALSSALALPTAFARDLALHRLAQESDADALAQMIGAVAGTGRSSGGRSAAAGIFLQRLVGLAPERALQIAVDAMPIDTEYFLSVVFSSWAENDLEAALAAVAGLPSRQAQQIAGDAILYAWGRVDDERLAAIVDRLPSTYQSRQARNRVLGRQVAEDPTAALEAALAVGDRVTRWQQVAAVGQLWASRDPAAALASAETITDANARLAFERAVISRWANTDPHAAIATVSRLRPGRERGQWLSSILGKLAKQDAGAALEWAAQLQAVHGHPGYAQVTLRTIAEYDAALAAANLDRLPNAQDRRSVLPSLAVAFARQQPETVMSWVNSLDNNSERQTAYAAAVNAIALSDPLAALQLLQTAPNAAMRDEALAGAVRVVAERNPQGAAMLLDAAPAGSLQHRQAVQTLAYQWAVAEPYAALAWARELDDGARREAIGSVLGTLAQRDLFAATELLGTLSGADRHHALQGVAQRYASQRPQQMLQWLEAYEGEPGYDDALRNAISTWMRNDPNAAFDAVLRQFEATALQDLAPSMMMSWSQRDPASAAAAIERMPETLQASTASTVASMWAQQDSRSALRWADGLDREAGRDQAIASVLTSGRTFAGAMGEEAFDWVEEIDDVEQRQMTAYNVLSKIARDDPQLALANLDRVPLPPRQRALLVQRIEDQ
ncbi:MAG: hypothetical protein AAGA68_05505 [Pseudomonadota bacterium]